MAGIHQSGKDREALLLDAVGGFRPDDGEGEDGQEDRHHKEDPRPEPQLPIPLYVRVRVCVCVCVCVCDATIQTKPIVLRR